MSSIQSSAYPLVFPVDTSHMHPAGLRAGGPLAIRVAARSLEGMQKEALVACGGTDTLWRLVSDEGPYLNGTDLAPFPLAFFTTALVAGYLSAVLRTFRAADIPSQRLEIRIDNRYSMVGSALKGTMRGGAEDPELHLRFETNQDGEIQERISEVIDGYRISRWLGREWAEAFALTVNGSAAAAGLAPRLSGEPEGRPDVFDQVRPANSGDFSPDIITKLASAASLVGADGGAGSSLAGDQKRMLHVRGTGALRDDGLIGVRIELFKPIGSSFRFLADPSVWPRAGARAPAWPAYLGASVAFCFLTQLGRYAQIVQRPLDDYRIIQDMDVGLEIPDPIRTQVFLDTPDGMDYGTTLVRMGAQTCFLHAACAKALHPRLSFGA